MKNQSNVELESNRYQVTALPEWKNSLNYVRGKFHAPKDSEAIRRSVEIAEKVLKVIEEGGAVVTKDGVHVWFH